MTLFERVSELAKKQHIGLKELATRLGLSESAIYQWRTSSPKSETLAKVADYFGVTTDYLLGRTDYPSKKSENDISPKGRAIGRDYDNFGPSQKAFLEKMIAAMQEDDEDDD